MKRSLSEGLVDEDAAEVLLVLHAYGNLPRQEIAEKAGVTPEYLSGVLEIMQADGLIDQDDGCREFFLTPHGKSLLEGLAQIQDLVESIRVQKGISAGEEAVPARWGYESF